MAGGKILERGDGARLMAHFLGDIPPGEVFKTTRGNTVARAGHGRVVLLGGRFELDATHWVAQRAKSGLGSSASLATCGRACDS